MNAGCDQRQEEHRKDLGIDAFPDLLLGHAHLLHDLKPGLIFITLRYLLIIDDQHRGKNKDDAEENPQEKQPGVNPVKIRPLLCHALNGAMEQGVFVHPSSQFVKLIVKAMVFSITHTFMNTNTAKC